MYLDAIESNYCHEQMTPLHCILANSKIIYRRLEKLFGEVQALKSGCVSEDNTFSNVSMNSKLRKGDSKKAILSNDGQMRTDFSKEETLKIMKAVELSGKKMFFYNHNQI